METELSRPGIPRHKPQEFEHVVMVVVPEGAIQADLQQLEKRGVKVRDQVVTVEYEYGDNDMALADYQFSDGAFCLVKKYDSNVHWPDVVAEKSKAQEWAGDVPFLVKKKPESISTIPSEGSRSPEPPPPSPPPAPPPETPPASPTPPEWPSFESEREWELLQRYWRLVAQIEDAQLKIEQAKITERRQEIPIQTRRLEIGQKNLQQFLVHHPEYTNLPKPLEVASIDLASVEGRRRAKALLLDSDLSPVEAGKRIIAIEKAGAKIELHHPKLEQGVGTSAVRPPLKTVMTDLKEAQYRVGRLNSLGLLSQLQHGDTRHNNLLRLKSTRQSLEYILKRFSPPPHADSSLSRDFLALLHGVVDAVKKVEQGTQKNFLSRWWSQNELIQQHRKIGQGLKKLEQFTQEHREFVYACAQIEFQLRWANTWSFHVLRHRPAVLRLEHPVPVHDPARHPDPAVRAGHPRLALDEQGDRCLGRNGSHELALLAVSLLLGGDLLRLRSSPAGAVCDRPDLVPPDPHGRDAPERGHDRCGVVCGV
ncbi:MAG: hypothetical protein AAB558_01130 [Patescibacteria group bacterium]